MSFTRAKPGDWAVGEVLTSDQQNKLDIDHARAIDGTGGGFYTPSDDLDVQSPTGKVVAINGCSFPSAADGGGAACTGPFSVSGAVECSSLVSGTVQATTSLMSNTDTTLGSNSGNALTVNATSTFAAPVAINAAVTCNNRVRSLKRFVVGGDAGSVYQYSPASYDFIYVPPGHSVGASTRWKISTGYTPVTASQSGEVISFRHLGTGSAVTIQDQAGTTITTIGPAGSGNLIRVDVGYDQLVGAFAIVDLGYQP